MNLFFRKSGKGFPIVILHGLYGSSDNWLSIGKELSKSSEVYLIDQRNHGNSPHNDAHNYFELAEDLNDFLIQQSLEKINLIGHSMGGKASMFFADKYAHKLNKLIIVDISPIQYLSSTQALEHYRIIENLEKIDLSLFKKYSEIEACLIQELKDKRLAAFILKSIKRNEDGLFEWKINIPVLRKNLDSIFVEFHPESEINIQTLFIKGENSEYLPEEHFGIIKKLFPKSEILTIPNAGHWVHAEQASLFCKAADYFLKD